MTSTPAVAQRNSGLLGHLRQPMHRNAYALITSTGLTSVLGMGFWVVAARLLPTDAVGTGAALTSAITFLATLSTLGLRNGLVRFLGSAGPSTRRLVAACYGLCAATAMLAAFVFILGQPWWARELGLLRSSVQTEALFMLAAAVWVIFVLQDHVLLGLRRAVWVPVANGIYSVAKIALLPLLVGAASWAVFTAYVLPAAAVAAVVTVLLFRHLGRPSTPVVSPEQVRIGQVVRFAVSDHVATLVWLSTTQLLTLVVLQHSGAEASAYYFMAFTIAYTLYLITSNVGSALVAEAAHYPEKSVELARQALRNAARLVVPLSVVCCLAAPLGLRLLGRDYEVNGSGLLRLLLLSAIPQLVVGISLSTARIRNDNRVIVLTYTALAVLVFGGTLLTIDRWGLTAVGLVWLVSQTLVATALVLTGRTGLWPGQSRTDVAVGALSTVKTMLRRRHTARRTRPTVLRVLRSLEATRSVERYELLTSDNDALVVAVDTEHGPAVAKMSRSAASAAGLHRHGEMLAELSTLPVDHLRSLVPTLLEHTVVDGQTVTLETRLPGTTPVQQPFSPATFSAAFHAISAIHAASARTAVLDDVALRSWVMEPVARLAEWRSLRAHLPALHRLADSLRQHMSGQQVTVSVTHGDYWLGNVLAETAAGEVDITGILDWENSSTSGLPDLDVLHLWLTAQPGELGSAVVTAITQPIPPGGLPMPLRNPDLPLDQMILLVWLGHVSAGLERAALRGPGRVWVARNVKPVLRALEARERSGSA